KSIFDSNCALAFRRLSIIDLEKGSQPFTDKTGRFTGIFNGEIYNYLELRDELMKQGYVFETRSEIETLVTLYEKEGAAFIRKLRGMFSIVIYDRVENTVFTGRDPFGIKPFYYRENQGGVVFSSEFKAFLFDSTMPSYSVNNEYLQNYFTFQYVTEPDTVTDDIKILPAGHYAVIRQGERLKPEPYIDISFKPDPSISFDEKEKRLRKAVENSIAAHMLSDVPVGSFLSSGIDSAVITAVASKLCPGIKAFTVAFGVKEYSEIDNAAGIAKHLDVEHIKLVAGLEEFLDAYDKVMYHLDSPMADPSVVAIYLVCQEAARHVKVVLSGEGSDELFAGYKLYRTALSADKIYRLPSPLRGALALLAKALPDCVKGKHLLMRGTTPLEKRFVGNAFVFDEAEKAKYFKKYDPSVCFTDRTADIYKNVQGMSTLTKMQYCDLNTWLKSDILVKGDRLSMAHSLEARVPYLDKEVFEAARDLCDSDKLRDGTTKYILRHAFRDLVNEETVMRPKLGYPVPVRVWLKNELYDWARDIISSPYADEYINKAEALKLLEAHRAGKGDHYKKLWVILTFITWYRIYVQDADKTRQQILDGSR
ncbi:MAG: asparagine synthase (glutamine-hydrolyzing), partial [Eubacteriales bacterium]